MSTVGPRYMREIGTPKLDSHIMNSHIKRPHITRAACNVKVAKNIINYKSGYIFSNF